MLFGIEKNRHYLEGYPFTVVTEYSCLKWLLNLRDPSGRLARWALNLQPYDFRIENGKDELNIVADALSRIAKVTAIANNGGELVQQHIEDESYDMKLYKANWKIPLKLKGSSTPSYSGCNTAGST